MMKAIVIIPFPGLPDGAAQVRNFAEGDVVEGDLAAVAVGEGWAEEVDPDYEPEEDAPPPKKASGSRKSSRKASGGEEE